MGIRSRIDGRGRVSIPSAYRQALGWERKDALVLTLEGNGILIRKKAVALTEVQQLAASYAGGRKLVDELLKERADET